jgi:hypothetical protein
MNHRIEDTLEIFDEREEQVNNHRVMQKKKKKKKNDSTADESTNKSRNQRPSSKRPLEPELVPPNYKGPKKNRKKKSRNHSMEKPKPHATVKPSLHLGSKRIKFDRKVSALVKRMKVLDPPIREEDARDALNSTKIENLAPKILKTWNGAKRKFSMNVAAAAYKARGSARKGSEMLNNLHNLAKSKRTCFAEMIKLLEELSKNNDSCGHQARPLDFYKNETLKERFLEEMEIFD